MIMRCSSCGKETPFCTSRKLPGNRGGCFEVNKRSVYATHGGRAQLGNFCGMLELQQPITTMAFNSTLKEIEISAVAEAVKCMSDASTRLKEFIRLNNPDKIEIDEEGRGLPSVFMPELKPIFDRLSEENLLKRCLTGLTQNQNESINSILWTKISKARFCGKRRIAIATCETVCTANTGAASKASILQRLGIEPGRNTVSLLRKEDWARLACASRKVTARYCKQQKLKRFEKMKRKKEVSYLPGAFGIAKVPEKVGRKLGVKAAKKTWCEGSQEKGLFMWHHQMKQELKEMIVAQTSLSLMKRIFKLSKIVKQRINGYTMIYIIYIYVMNLILFERSTMIDIVLTLETVSLIL